METVPVVVQEVLHSKQDFPKPGEWFKFRGRLLKVICSRIHIKVKKMYFVNIWLEEPRLIGL
jgi:hypothetical protein